MRLTGVVTTGLVLLGLGAPAYAADSPNDTARDATLVTRSGSSGTTAGQDDTSALALAALRADMSVDELEDLINNDGADVTPEGVLGYVDTFESADEGSPAKPAGSTATDGSGDPEAGSRPDAPLTLYIDFDGATLERTVWNRRFDEEVLELEEDPTAADPDYVYEIWAQVAEDYAPFNINVTTSYPGQDALIKSSEEDTEYGVTAIVTDSAIDDYRGYGYYGFGNAYYNSVLIYAPHARHDPAVIGKVVSHEVGHNLQLDHHGMGEEEYAAVQEQEPDSVWAPIMGGSKALPLLQWSRGDYADATRPDQHDLAVITDPDGGYRTIILWELDGDYWPGGYCTYAEDPANPGPDDQVYKPGPDGTCTTMGDPLEHETSYTGTAAFVEDDHGDQIEEASSIDLDSGQFTVEGLINTSDDVDVFAFTTEGGSVTVSAEPAEIRPNLDIELQLLDSDGEVVAWDDPDAAANVEDSENSRTAVGLDAAITEQLSAGEYFLVVDGVGHADPADNTPTNGVGYSDYGSLGRYRLTGNVSTEAEVSPAFRLPWFDKESGTDGGFGAADSGFFSRVLGGR